MDDRMGHANKRFALFAPPPEDPDFARVRDLLINTVTRAANKARAECAIAHGISFWETTATITPDPDKPNFVTVTAYPRAVVRHADA
jgi:hypothetical protein